MMGPIRIGIESGQHTLRHEGLCVFSCSFAESYQVQSRGTLTNIKPCGTSSKTCYELCCAVYTSALERLPSHKTANGSTMPSAPERINRSNDEHMAPRIARRKVLAAITSEALMLERVGIDDSVAFEDTPTFQMRLN